MNDDSMRPVQPQPLINKVSLPATRLVTAMAVTAVLFLVVSASLVWMHVAVRQMERAAEAEGVPTRTLPELPEM